MKGIVAVYVSLINKGIKTVDEVPKKLRAEVQKAIEEQK